MGKERDESGVEENWEGEANRFLNSTPPGGEEAWGTPSSNLQPTHECLPKLRELTQDRRCKEKQLFSPGFRLCPHHD